MVQESGSTAQPARVRPSPEALDLRVVYEDEWVLVLDKPPGIVVHPTYKNSSGTLLNGVLWRLRARAEASPGILTRLDKHTSGLVVIGITPAIHAAMQRDAVAARVSKTYLAMVHGTPSPATGVIRFPLGRDTADRRLVVVREDGQPCETRYDTSGTAHLGDATVATLRCVPVTGRTHQIRVHLAASGWPVVGDRVYGRTDDTLAPRQALHAWQVTLPHPVTRQRLELEAPLPDDLRHLVG